MSKSWHYLSFADDDNGFLGGAYVEGNTHIEAHLRATLLGINPGGEVMFVGPLPAEALAANVPEEQRERLLSQAEIEGGRLR